MQTIFTQLIDSFIANGVGKCYDFLNPELIQQLSKNILRLYGQESFKEAGTSNHKTVVNKAVRSDYIYWLDKAHKDKFEQQFFTLIDAFVAELNNSCYTGITDYEFHYALYPAGAFYTKHLDQFRSNDSRKYSMIFYLNESWLEGDGGELCIHKADTQQMLIAPEAGVSVFFDSSELMHEVLLTHKPRMSITGWLKVSI